MGNGGALKKQILAYLGKHLKERPSQSAENMISAKVAIMNSCVAIVEDAKQEFPLELITVKNHIAYAYMNEKHKEKAIGDVVLWFVKYFGTLEAKPSGTTAQQ